MQKQIHTEPNKAEAKLYKEFGRRANEGAINFD